MSLDAANARGLAAMLLRSPIWPTGFGGPTAYARLIGGLRCPVRFGGRGTLVGLYWLGMVSLTTTIGIPAAVAIALTTKSPAPSAQRRACLCEL